MSRQERDIWHLRTARFETVEERLVLSAEPIISVVLHGNLIENVQDEVVAYDHHALDLQSSDTLNTLAASVHDTTGVHYVQNTFGLTGAGQTVAVIDSGIAWDHHYLGRGYGANYRVVGGWDFAENDANPYDDAPAGFHGTHVAGIIGSDHTTYTGVAPDVDLVALRVFNDAGQGNFAWVESALQWVITNRNSFENPITTVNMSLGVPSMNGSSIPNWAMLEDELQTLNSLGVFVAVSAGNDFQQFNTQGLSYPAVSDWVVPVASANDYGTAMSSFSQRDDHVLVAPGETITSTVPDALFSFNGVPNDWASASGTSMASPYVAGASVLVREAYWSIGVTNVNQDMIYDTLFATADLIYDPLTAASYRFIDVQAAVQSILGGGSQTPPPPTDGDATGNSAQSPTQLGTLANGSNFAGQIASSVDQDFYGFTAGSSGRMTLTANASAGLTTQWQIVGSSAQVQGSLMTLDVVAGQSYVVGLTSSAGIGSYSVQVSLQAITTDLGIVDFRQVDDVQIGGERWYRLTALRSGALAVEAYSTGGQQLGIQVYNAAQQAIGNVDIRTNFSRADAVVSAGQTVLVRLTGNSANTDLKFANVLAMSGNRVQVFGSSADDTVTLRAGTTTALTINGVYYSFSTSHFSNVVFEGGAGKDTLQFTGTSSNESVELRAGSARIAGSNWQFHANSVDNLRFTGNGGADSANVIPASGSPVAYNVAAQPTYNFDLTAAGIARHASEQGVADLGTVDLRQVDNVQINGERWYRLTAARTGLLAVEAYTAGGQQLGMQVYNSSQQAIANIDVRSGFSRADAFVTAGQTVLVRITGSSTDTDLKIANVLSTVGNSVHVHGSAANEVFTLRAGPVIALTVNGVYYSFSTAHFSNVTLHGGGGNDTLQFTGTTGNESAELRVGNGRIAGPGYVINVNSFSNVDLAGGGGFDSLSMWDSAGDDVLTIDPNSARLRGSAFDHRATGFRRVAAYATSGGYDLATTTGVAGDANYSISGFDQINGSSASWERELTALDYVFQRLNLWN